MEINDAKIENRKEGNEWQAAIDSIPPIAEKCHQLIELASENPKVLEANKWKSSSRGLDSPRIESFSALGGKKTPDGIEMNLTMSYPDSKTKEPEFITIYGNNPEGPFGFSYSKDGLDEKGAEEVEIKYGKGLWQFRISYLKRRDNFLNIYLDHKTDSDSDRLLIIFKGASFNSQGKIKLNKENSTLATIVHMPYSSFWRNDIPLKDSQSLFEVLKQADRERKKELEENPKVQTSLAKRGIELPVSDYADLQNQRLNSTPSGVDWQESLNIVNGNAIKALESFSSLLKT